ncbi:phosphoserine phosphatase SerB [Pseudidiomarina sp.]|uniref:phosphoserine phosphatase SerB n=1 Tax=Pseudidiomarina sp. TaxID=2081707 RepID=UPI00299D5CD5|nr:phosphoserine phosphatase SerB [Pseudidiomarina sp.]MDX1706241.1 phosphoserine phosphatase SerB [Pseudidiomarina sp.]
MIDLSRPGLIVFDMDSTLITIECIDEIAGLAGRKAEVSAITEAAMRGQLDFAASLQQRVQVLAGVAETELTTLFDPIPVSPGAAELIAWFKQLGWKTAVVSGGFTWFTQKLRAALKLDADIANQLEWYQQQLTGRVSLPIVDAQVKADSLRQLAQRWQIDITNTIAVGDGANDIPMLQAAGLGVAFCAKPKLKEIADIVIESPDLMLLKTQLEQRVNHHGKS